MNELTAAVWIILIGTAVAGACSLVGCFLILRRLAMLGDAISHAILPGIVLAFLIFHTRASWAMALGAMAFGLLAVVLIQTLQRGGVPEDAGIGVIFTALFAVGVLLIAMYGRNMDIDLEHLLYGEIAYAPFDTLTLGALDLGPRSLWVMGGIFAANIVITWIFYKEFKLSAFDPGLAAAVGINTGLVHYLQMIMVSVTTVGAFESVGAILVVAMLIVPGATAYLLTDRLHVMLFLSVVLGAVASALGYGAAVWLNASIAGAMVSVAGVLFALALVGKALGNRFRPISSDQA